MKKNLGAVYTPILLADWVASELIARLPRNKPVLVIDPACGDGALLKSVQKLLRHSSSSIAGVDIDPAAVREAKAGLPPGTLLKQADALVPGGTRADVEEAWKNLLFAKAIAGVISNPPWGSELGQKPDELRKAGYRLAQGQFDSYELFIELCLRIVPERAVLAFIIPDSLFLPEHKALRTMLLEKTQLYLIARLGEGFFADVYRGTAVVVCEKAKPALRRPIECFRLRKELRDRVFSGQMSLQEAKADATHLVPQKHFQEDPEKRFSIDVSGDDLAFFESIHRHRSDWANWLISGRGVELSKMGMIIFCPQCGVARPEPRERTTLTCEHCGAKFRVEEAQRKSIVKTGTSVPKGWRRLIVGKDVDRYRCVSSRIIEENVPGINYKTAVTFQGSKLLVRKTGIGIKAAIDDSEAFTNQVVFHYRSRPIGTPSFFLNYVLGVLCSRVMLAYHLKRTGESEWRSHPYVTQKTIAELPVPIVSEGKWQWRQAQAIADAAAKRRASNLHDAADDLYVDSLVAGLYDLDERGCAWVLGVLDQAQGLEAIKTMRTDIAKFRPVRV